MPDITMCSNSSCPRRLTCFRFIARAAVLQSYTRYTPETDKCFVEAYTAEIEDYKKRMEEGK